VAGRVADSRERGATATRGHIIGPGNATVIYKSIWVDNYLQVITAQTVLLANQRNDIDIERRRMDASVLLVKAVGGGWDTSQLPKY
jgi:hypothetical protein